MNKQVSAESNIYFSTPNNFSALNVISSSYSFSTSERWLEPEECTSTK